MLLFSLFFQLTTASILQSWDDHNLTYHRSFIKTQNKTMYLLINVVLDGDNWQLTRVQVVMKDKYDSLEW